MSDFLTRIIVEQQKVHDEINTLFDCVLICLADEFAPKNLEDRFMPLIVCNPVYGHWTVEKEFFVKTISKYSEECIKDALKKNSLWIDLCKDIEQHFALSSDESVVSACLTCKRVGDHVKFTTTLKFMPA